jgi:hypothetical protein
MWGCWGQRHRLTTVLPGTRRMFEEGAEGENHPHELCDFFDSLLDEQGFVIAPKVHS